MSQKMISGECCEKNLGKPSHGEKNRTFLKNKELFYLTIRACMTLSKKNNSMYLEPK